LRLFADLVEEGSWVEARLDTGDPTRQPLPKPDVRSMLRGLGPVGVFGASNFPLAFSVAGGDTASALAAGCPVIVKAHPAHPATSEIVGHLICEAARECQMPEGVFSLLFDAAYDVGMALVKHPKIKAVGFTGSRRGGLALMQAAATRNEPIPVFAEMSSINPVVITAGALHERGRDIATGLHGAVTMGVGQFCTNPGLVFLPEGEAGDGFLRDFLVPTTETAPGAMLTAGICAAYQQGVQKLGNNPRVVTHLQPSSQPSLAGGGCSRLL
jgi:NADP-dependent aldehyde dehydrogenase